MTMCGCNCVNPPNLGTRDTDYPTPSRGGLEGLAPSQVNKTTL